jgi:hypothetical protein
MEKTNYKALIFILNEYLCELEHKVNIARVRGDIMEQGNLILKINKVIKHLDILKTMMNKENEIWNSTPDNICWVLDDDAEKAILYFDLGENIESGRYLIIGGNNIDKFINKEKFDYFISDNVKSIDKLYSMELTHDEVELINKHRNENK